MNRFSLHFTAFVGSASALALVLVAGISFACQSARAAMGGDKGSEMRFTPASRPQDGLSHPVNTGRPTGGKPVDLRRATREAHSSSVSIRGAILSTRHLRSKDQLGREPWASEQGVSLASDQPNALPGNPFGAASPRRGSGLPRMAPQVDRSQGVRSVPGRAVPNDVVLLRDARGHSLQGFRGGAAWKDIDTLERLKTGFFPILVQSTVKQESAGVMTSRHLETLATAAAHLCGVPVRLFHSLIARESSWNPRARSSSGALGLGQLMPAAAKEMGVEDRLDPWQNALGAACFLRKQYDRAGSWRKALLSYHAGPNRLRTSQATHDYARDIIEGSAN